MNIKGVTLFALFFISIGFFIPQNTKAINLQETTTSPNSIIVKLQERIEYLFALKIENKISVLEKHAEKRLNMAQEYAEEGNNEKVQSMIQGYQQIKEKQNNLLEKVDNAEELGSVAERTIEQQKTMEEIKTQINNDGKNNIIKVQEQIVNQVAKHVTEVNGTEGTTEFLNQVMHVWAPGTGPGGGESGVTYEGGGKLIYAKGSGPGEGRVVIEGGEMKFATDESAGGPSGSDIKTEDVKNGNIIEEKADPGTDDTKVWIAP